MGANIDIFAHSIEGADEADWETLAAHLVAVGNTASVFASAFGASTAAQAMGLLHDIGKCSQAYQAYIREPRTKGGLKGPDHSSAGNQEAYATYWPTVGKLMAFGLAGHHAGLMDGSGHDGGTLARRLPKPIEPYDGWRDHAIGLPVLDELKAVFHPPKLNGIAQGSKWRSSRACCSRVLSMPISLKPSVSTAQHGGMMHRVVEALSGRIIWMPSAGSWKSIEKAGAPSCDT